MDKSGKQTLLMISDVDSMIVIMLMLIGNKDNWKN